MSGGHGLSFLDFSLENVSWIQSLCILIEFVVVSKFSVGYVLEKKSGGKDMQSLDGEVSNFVSRAEFQNITYWNHDTMPSAEDPLPRCFHWLTIANAVSICFQIC